jgi:hypothetical protein
VQLQDVAFRNFGLANDTVLLKDVPLMHELVPYATSLMILGWQV